MCCGCFPITSNIGALIETSNGMGKYVKMSGKTTSSGWIPDNHFYHLFSQEIIRCLYYFDVTRDKYEFASKAISDFAVSKYDWEKLSKEWEKIVNHMVINKTN